VGLTSLDRYAILLSPSFEVLKGTHLPDEPKKINKMSRGEVVSRNPESRGFHGTPELY
jgi:hypothetical protein